MSDQPEARDDRLLAAASYLTFLVGLALIGPILIYAWKRRSSPLVAQHALQAAILQLVTVPAFVVVLAVSWVIGALLQELAPFTKIHAWTMLVSVLLFAAAAIAAYAVGVVRALRGGSFHVPVLGAWLERQLAGRGP